MDQWKNDQGTIAGGGKMKVYKFGGASVKDAGSVCNVSRIIKEAGNDQMMVVVSAMGKTTNALEAVTNAYYHKTGEANNLLEKVRKEHENICHELFGSDKAVSDRLNNIFVEIEWILDEEPHNTYDFIYDQLVSQGEMLSTVIVAAWLQKDGVDAKWIDARDLIRTDNTYRQAVVDWNTSKTMLDTVLEKHSQKKVLLTQGFIGGTSENYTTTLGREGSDYTAAILAYLSDASAVTIWKDVPGVLNADPKFFTECVLLEQLSYQDALELAYYGASVIHPKTIRPLQNKKIPLFVRSFLDPTQPCTEISYETGGLQIPGFIFKLNQVLISISPRDFSFIVEENLRQIFEIFASHRVHIHIMQNSALSFTVCVDEDVQKTKPLIDALSKDYAVRYNYGLELVTIRNADVGTIERLTQNKEILLDLRSRNTVQLVVRPLNS